MAQRKTVAVQGHYREDGTYVQPHSKTVVVSDNNRATTVRDSLGSALDDLGGMEDGGVDYSGNIAEDSWDVELDHVTFGPEGMVTNTTKWAEDPFLSEAEVNGEMRFAGGGVVKGGSYDGQMFVAGADIKDSVVESNSTVDVRVSEWDGARIHSGSTISCIDMDLHNSDVQGNVRMVKLGMVAEVDDGSNKAVVSNSTIKAPKRIGADMDLTRSTMEGVNLTMEPRSRISMENVNMSDSKFKVPVGKIAVMNSHSQGEVDVREARVLDNEHQISGKVDDVCLVAAHGVGPDGKTDRDTVHIFSGVDMHTIRRGSDGQFAVRKSNRRDRWYNGMHQEKAEERLSALAEKYAGAARN